METCAKCHKESTYTIPCIDAHTGEYRPLCMQCHDEEFGEEEDTTMRAYLRNDDGSLEIKTLQRVPGSPGELTDGHGIINLADMLARTTLRGWPDEGPAGIYRTNLGWEYVVPHPITEE